MNINSAKTALIILVGLTAPMALGGCAVVAGAAAVDYFVDDNDVCDGPNDVGLLDSDCNDNNPN
ncbi:hypothetical protein U91I_01729 [alpha proteobacterium U9-1i]|nr:hypothetical protein U91I_01729 [alpha proteobacterium U9-1i]